MWQPGAEGRRTMTLNARVVPTSALPVPRSLAGKTSGESAKRVAYLTLFANV